MKWPPPRADQFFFGMVKISRRFFEKGVQCTYFVCCSSARQSHAFDEGIVAWRVISKQILLRL
jgi:hypothetical protein